MPWRRDLGRDADELEHLDQVVGHIDLPPAVLVARARRIVVVIVVPTLARSQQGDEPVVAAVVVGSVARVAEHVGERIHRPSDVPHDDRAHDHAPNQQAPAHFEREARADREVQRRLHEIDPNPRRRLLQLEVEGVFEHIARILLVSRDVVGAWVVDEQPSDMRPEEGDQRAMRVVLLVGMHMVVAVGGDPTTWCVLDAAKRKDHHRVLEPLRHLRALVGKQAVIAKRDRLPEHKHARQHDPKPRPTKKVGHEC